MLTISILKTPERLDKGTAPAFEQKIALDKCKCSETVVYTAFKTIELLPEVKPYLFNRTQLFKQEKVSVVMVN